MKKQKEVINTELIDNYMEKNKLTKSEFCSLCKIPSSTLEKIYIEDYDFDLKHFFRIAYTIDIHPKDMFIMLEVNK